MGLRMRSLGLVGVVLAAGVLLTACPKANGYQVVQAFPGLSFDKMLGLQPVPGDGTHALLLTQDGVIRYADLADGSATPPVFLDIRDRMIRNPENEEGLLGLAFAPDYATSGRFYIYYTRGEPRRSTLSRFVAHGATADPASEQVLLSIPEPFSNHNGGALAFGPDGMLYVAVGDGGSGGDPMGYGQRLDTLHGKILRLDVSGDAYAVPPDNPFVGQDARGEIFAYGLRNPWRLSFDRETGQLWAGDAGQDLWEEVDRIVAGGTTAGTGWRGRTVTWRRGAMSLGCCCRGRSTATNWVARSSADTCTGATRCRSCEGGMCSATSAAGGSGRWTRGRIAAG